jgi:hypothetical protein
MRDREGEDIASHFGIFLSARFIRGSALAWSYEDLLTSLSPHDVWTAAEESRDIHLAIGLEALRILRATSQRADLKSVPAFAIGSGFYDSLVRNSARYGQALHRLDEAGGLA